MRLHKQRTMCMAALSFLIMLPAIYGKIIIYPALNMNGRFGDNLLEIFHCLWIEYVYPTQCVFSPASFTYSDQLKIHTKKIKNNYIDNRPKRLLSQKGLMQFIHALKQGDINSLEYYKEVIIPYFPESVEDRLLDINGHWASLPINWHDEKFKKKLQYWISPLHKDIRPMRDNNNAFIIALHIREGGSYDYLSTKRVLTLKFPPLSYYEHALNIANDYIKNKFYTKKTIECRIFTDSQNPMQLCNYFSLLFPTIKFTAKEGAHDWNQNVLEDFFNMIACDALIRPQSNFSLAAAKLANYVLEIEPINYDKNLITTIRINHLQEHTDILISEI